jgi:O-antigen/teichoic acid export membrane protein
MGILGDAIRNRLDLKRRWGVEAANRLRLPFAIGHRSRYAIALFAGQLIFALLLFAASVLAARLLGPAGKGEYTAWTLATAVAALALAGSIPVGLGRAYLDSERVGLVRTALRHGALVLGVVAVAVAPAILLGVNAVAVVFCILVAVPATVVNTDLRTVMQAAKRAWSQQASRIAMAAVVAVGMTGLLIAPADDRLDIAFGVWAAAAVASALTAALVAHRVPGARHGRGTLRDAARRGERSYLARLIDFLLLRVDQFIVVAITGPFGLGLYSVAVNWSEVSWYVGASIGQAVFEDRRTLDDQAAGRILRRAAWVLAFTTLVVTIAGFFLISPIFGGPFEDSRWPLLLLAPGLVAKGLAYTGGQILMARGTGWVLSKIMLRVLVAGLAMWGGLTYLFGIEGAAAGTTAVYALQMVVTLRALFRADTAQPNLAVGPSQPKP